MEHLIRISEEVQAICERHGISYNVGPLRKQFGSVVKKICKLALPGKEPAETADAPESRVLTAA